MASKKSPARRWVVTINNYTPEDIDKFKKFAKQQCDYCIFGKELSRSGTPHLQGFICLNRKLRLTTLKNSLIYGGHYEMAYAPSSNNLNYCKKQGDFWEFGSKPKYKSGSTKSKTTQAASSFIKTIETSSSLADYMHKYPALWLMHGHKLMNNYMLTVEPQHRPNFYAIWLVGPTGVGKTHFAHELFPEAYVKDPTIKWWLGYRLQSTVIVDNMDESTLKVSSWHSWLDRYPCIVETKGGDIPLLADEFILTSLHHPSSIFSRNTEAFLRRVKVFEINKREDLEAVKTYVDEMREARQQQLSPTNTSDSTSESTIIVD